MVPGRDFTAEEVRSAPRARGDGPLGQLLIRRRVHCSPRTRGWSPHGEQRRVGSLLLPAHAGMVPVLAVPGPEVAAAPRARGDGPLPACGAVQRGACSPRTRGWSLVPEDQGSGQHLLPAHAGMVPSRAKGAPPSGAAPRARGDGPLDAVKAEKDLTCSPRTRGWSQFERAGSHFAELLPAHAGMVPVTAGSSLVAEPAPRARGDGPASLCRSRRPPFCSPRTRGWSR